MGREIAGFLRAEARGEKGKTLILRYGEELDDGGNVRWRMPYDTEKFKEKFVSEFYCQEKRLIKDRKASGHCSVGSSACALAAGLERYCIAASEYFGGAEVYETDEMAATEVSNLEQYRGACNGAAEGISIDSCSLVLDSTMSVKLYFTVAEGRNTDDYSFKVNGETVSAVFN